jgi:hypothetical protein
MFLDGGLGVAGNVGDLVQAAIRLVAALPLRAPTITQTLDIERVSELQQPVLELGQRPKICGRRALEPLSSLKSR